MGVDRVALRVGEDPSGWFDPNRRLFGCLPGVPGGEDGKGGGVEIDAPPRVAGLAPGFVRLVADGDQSPVDRDALVMSTSSQRSPSSSLRRIPVAAISQKAGNIR